MIRHKALIVDYDGTIAHNSTVPESTVEALLRVKRSGRKLILCTGRQIRFLAPVFPRLDIFDIVVAENGGTLYFPETREELLLTEPPNSVFVEALKKQGVDISLGKTIVAAWEPDDKIIFEEIRKQGLELHVIFNKGAVMVLPAGVTKASGLLAALKEIEISVHNIAGVGDAENDHAFLRACETSAAVANALPSLKEKVDHVLTKDHGPGAEELIEQMLKDDLQSWRSPRHDIRIGKTAVGGRDVHIDSSTGNILVIGASGGGKSTFTTGFLQSLIEHRFQALVLDPEGDYERFEKMLTLGDGKIPPSEEQAVEALRDARRSVITNLLAIKMDKRPHFLQRIFPKAEELRAKYGRPHWVIVDEAHHMLEEGFGSELAKADCVVYITVHPNRLPQELLKSLTLVVAVGAGGDEALRELLPALGRADQVQDELRTGEALVLDFKKGIQKIELMSPGRYHSRHRRKYAEGTVGDERSFIFRGPENKLRLKAGNLQLFLQLAEGVDDGTWMHHLKRHEYSLWFRDEIKDNELAKDTEIVENDESLLPDQSRARVRELVEKYYVVPSA